MNGGKLKGKAKAKAKSLTFDDDPSYAKIIASNSLAGKQKSDTLPPKMLPDRKTATYGSRDAIDTVRLLKSLMVTILFLFRSSFWPYTILPKASTKASQIFSDW